MATSAKSVAPPLICALTMALAPGVMAAGPNERDRRPDSWSAEAHVAVPMTCCLSMSADWITVQR